MRLTSAGPLRVASLLWQPGPGAFALTVVCKATFSLEPQRSPLAKNQEKLCKADVYWDDGAAASLRAPSDLVPFKRRLDVLVLGHAHAPFGQPVTSLVARLSVGEIDKRIEVHGDRFWTQAGQLSERTPFAKMPLRWERAAGGSDRWNPVGVPPDALPDARGVWPVPNLLPVGTALVSPAQAVPPAGFGPLAPAWPERVGKLGGHAATFQHEGWAEHPLPEDFDPGYFNVAPPDQQMDQLQGDNLLLLEHLHPEHASLVTVLEPVSPRAVAQRSGADPEEIQMRCDTMCVDADQGICTLTWRGSISLRHPSEDGVVLVATDQPASGVEEEGTTLIPTVHVDFSAETIEGLPPASDPALRFVASPEGGTALPVKPDTLSPPTVPYGVKCMPVIDVEGAPATGREPPPHDAAPPPHDAAPLPDVRPTVSAEEIGVERFAAICAEIAEERAERFEILGGHGLTEDAWAGVERRWRTSLDKEIALGAGELRTAYDRAYVEAVETRRGLITVPEYARILIALEQGCAYEVLDELRIQRQALLPIMDEWTKKLAADAALARKVRVVLAALRAR